MQIVEVGRRNAPCRSPCPSQVGSCQLMPVCPVFSARGSLAERSESAARVSAQHPPTGEPKQAQFSAGSAAMRGPLAKPPKRAPVPHCRRRREESLINAFPKEQALAVPKNQSETPHVVSCNSLRRTLSLAVPPISMTDRCSVIGAQNWKPMRRQLSEQPSLARALDSCNLASGKNNLRRPISAHATDTVAAPGPPACRQQ